GSVARMRTGTGIRALTSRWTVVVPLIAVVALVFSWGRDVPPWAVGLIALCLAGAVHRLGAVREADTIAVLRDGRIAELGSHDALMAAEGAYARLFALQAAGYRDTAAAHDGRQP
ncbi:hypothetical protein ACWGJW_26190, partial [Streptomyces nigrescens]